MTSRLDPVARGVVWQVVYASLFRAAAPRERLLSRLAGCRASEGDVERALRSPEVGEIVTEDTRLKLVHLRDEPGRAADFDATRRATREFLAAHASALALASRLPGARLVALSGGCAHENASDGDIDLFVVADEGRAWSTLLGFVARAKAAGLRRVLCLNFLVDEAHQELPWRDFYAGFEIVSLRPLGAADAPHPGFDGFLRANGWLAETFPNFPPSRDGVQNARQFTRRPRGPSAVERASRMIYRPYLRRRLAPGPGVELSDGRIRLHSTDHRERLRVAFIDRLSRLGVEAPAWN